MEEKMIYVEIDLNTLNKSMERQKEQHPNIDTMLLLHDAVVEAIKMADSSISPDGRKSLLYIAASRAVLHAIAHRDVSSFEAQTQSVLSYDCSRDVSFYLSNAVELECSER
ncbi:hypothetical protein NEMIN01_1868 [Nematocida minor]|uniref:uncharacterized protein n=1 Tax=Nematocida minor TaxID=1912983 RepID=UPI002220F949|nr:uncharacterized protein NEMIN01_1868 [Nematocida minor]KAI5192199.1 hypothetical protein NEMIN01_1868 [Nematocida minor]